MEISKNYIENHYIAYKVFCNLWFVGAIWLLFYRIFMTDQAVGVLDGLSFAFGLLAEIPSGALADYFGRKKIVMIGVVVSSLGIAAQGLAHGYGVILFGQMLATAGWAFRSGADDALFYDALNYEEGSSDWKKLVSKGNQAALITTLLSYLIGGYLYSVSPRLPFLVYVLGIGAAFTLLRVPEKSHKIDATSKVFIQYFHALVEGTKELTHDGIVGYLPLIIAAQGFFYAFGYGILRPIFQTRFGFGASAGAWVIFTCGLIAFLLQRLQEKHINDISEKVSITFILILTAGSLVLGTFPIGHVGFLVILVIYSSEYLLDPLISNGLNRHISSRHRATALSAASFLKSLPYVVVAPIIGYLNVRGKLQYFMLITSISILLSLLVYLKKVRTLANPAA